MASASRAAGSRVGPYELVAPLGAGGMGEVYRARDTKLGRDVALKFLPEALAGDPDRLARFTREAQTLASLNHPNIAQVYGLEDGVIVMELLDGQTLGARLAEGALPVRKAVEYAHQIARGLAAAHERGIIHRDLKPDNLFVLRDGHVKLIDFGLARDAVRTPSGATETSIGGPRGTEPGMVMGTVGYMAPEQVRGESLDARADLFALGAVLYEMLAGKRAFQRNTPVETMTAILREDPPDLAAERLDVNPGLERIVRHCLEKNPLERFQTARDVAFALDALSTVGHRSSASMPAVRPRRVPATLERALWAALTLAASLAAAWLAFGRGAPAPPVPAATYRAIIPFPDGLEISAQVVPLFRLAMSSDGRRVAFTGVSRGGAQTLWLQNTADAEARELPGTAGAQGPIWSPDGRSIVFSTSGVMKRLDIDSGTAVAIGDTGYGSWSANGELLVSSGPPAWTVNRLPSNGGRAVELMPSAPQTRPGTPQWLPDGRRFLHWWRRDGVDVVEVRSTQSSAVTPLPSLDGATAPAYAHGALLFSRGDRIFAQRFDADTAQLTGNPMLLAENVAYQSGNGAAFAVSESGALMYQAEEGAGKGRLTWLARDGHVLSTVADDANYSNVELSRDERRLAVSVPEAGATQRDIYLIDLTRGVRQRLTNDPSEERSAVWSADGRQVFYTSKGLDIYRRSSDFAAGDAGIQLDHASKDVRDVSADGRYLLYRRTGAGTGNDIWMLPLTGNGAPVALLASRFNENYGVFAPDARSMAYVSDESGRNEVYVMSLERGGGKVQISTAGGGFPRWRRDGKEILYLSPDNEVIAVPVTGSGATFQAGTLTPLFKFRPQPGPGTPFDVTADGQRFIVNAVLGSRLPPSLNLIVNWPSLLK